MARDIEEFLRRAAERRKQNQGQAAPQAKKPQPPPQQKAPPAQRRVVDEKRNTDEGDPYKVRPISKAAGESLLEPTPPTARSSEPPPKRKRKPVAEHVREAITEDRPGKSRKPAHEVPHAHVGKNFDHALGGLEGKSSIQQDRIETTDGDGSTEAALGLIELFKSPKTIRESILVSEILKRPNFDDY